MLRVLAVQIELQEYGEVIAVGDHVKRLGGSLRGGYFGTGLDEVEWGFDRYTELTSSEAVVIEGRVAAVAAVYVRLALIPGTGWAPKPGTAWLEPLRSTSETRMPRDRSEPSTPSSENDRAFPAPHRRPREDDEYLSGWLFTLDDEVVTPVPRSPSQSTGWIP